MPVYADIFTLDDHSYSFPAFVEYEKNNDIKYNNKIVVKNILDAIATFDNFIIYIYYHDYKSYYYALSLKRKLQLKTNNKVKIILCSHGCYYERHYSYQPHGVAVFYKNLSVSKTIISNKLAVTIKN